MAKLFLIGSEDVSVERLREALSERLSSKYDVSVSRGELADGVKVRKNALMAIVVGTHPKKGRTEFVTFYESASQLLMILLIVLIIPNLVLVLLSRSPSRNELEAEVLEAIRDEWPSVTSLD